MTLAMHEVETRKEFGKVFEIVQEGLKKSFPSAEIKITPGSKKELCGE